MFHYNVSFLFRSPDRTFFCTITLVVQTEMVTKTIKCVHLTLLNTPCFFLLFVPVRQEKADLALMSRLSPTSWLTGTTCNFRPPSRPMSRWGLCLFFCKMISYRSLLIVLMLTNCLTAFRNRHFGHHRLRGDRNSKGMLHHSGSVTHEQDCLQAVKLQIEYQLL